MSLLSDYEQKTAWKYAPISGSFHTHEGLNRKVNPDGSFAAFPGSTVVFRPGSDCAPIIQMMQGILHYRLSGAGMLAAPLPASTGHMTLHDLISPELCASETSAEYSREVKDSVGKAARLVEDLREKYAGMKIVMAADRIVNMVSKSLVLMLRPQTERDYELLLEIYRPFDAIQTLPYVHLPHLTPHITLAYFKPGVLDGDALGEAVNFAQINPDKAPVFAFSMEGLTAQRFLDMQTYLDVPERICFCCDGGLNRSVMAACILNHLAREKNLPVIGYARSAFSNTQWRPVPQQVWDTLKKNGIPPDVSFAAARYLEAEETSHFSAFAAITGSAMNRLSYFGLPAEKTEPASRVFFGVRDPEYGEISYDKVFGELYQRCERYLAAYADRVHGESYGGCAE